MVMSQNIRDTAPALTYSDYVRFSRLVHECYGLDFPEKRRADLESGLRRAFMASTCHNFSDYYQLLLDPDAGTVHLQHLVNALTVGESHFFRNAGHFDALYNYVLPRIVEQRRTLRTLRIWSAGCANGEEPYSIAIMLRELLPDVDDWAITIYASDVNTEALDRARKGVYRDWAFREERAKRCRARYFQNAGDGYELIPKIRQMVTFFQLNLAEEGYPLIENNTAFLDLIFCRNVTIYFPMKTTRLVVNRFYDCLVEGGWLFVGHSEHSLNTYRRFQACTYPNAVFYQRVRKSETLSVDLAPLLPLVNFVEPPVAVALQDSSLLINLEASASVSVLIEEEGDPPFSLPEADLLEMARELLDYGYSEQSRDILLSMVAQNSDFCPAVCALLCRVYANLGDLEDADFWCQRAIQLDALDLDAYYVRALVLQHRGLIDAAIMMMKKVIYLDNNFILGHYGLADLYHSLQLMSQALKSLENARRLLVGHVDDDLVPASGGITIGSLRESIIRQRRQWSAELSALKY